MASTIKVNNIQNQCGANIANKCGTTITLGASGDTITLACGASQTGFGRTGTVDWDTTAKTASFTAVSGNGYFVNTTSGAITLTLPASPSAGDIVAFKDYAFTFATNNLTVDGNGSPIGGVDGIILPTYNTNGTSKTFIYVDGTKGWLVTNESTDTSQESNAQYVTATGGTVTCCGDYKIHTFTSPGTFCVSCAGNPAGSDTVDYLVIAGGGSSSQGGPSTYSGAGGGAGGYRFSNGTASGCYAAGPSPLGASALPVSIQGYPITVGAGAARVPGCEQQPGAVGSNSVFSTITSAGGGAGRMTSSCIPSGPDSANGGSGGGGAAPWPGSCISVPGGSGNTPPVSPSQGNDGGATPTNNNAAGGGGGAGGAGGASPGAGQGGTGGAGLASSITGSPVVRGGGGGGSGYPGPGPAHPGGGGGGNGGTVPSTSGQAGTANTGGGGGGGASKSPPGSQTSYNAAGGSGIVIIRYKYQ
jgi:hypothetical protein